MADEEKYGFRDATYSQWHRVASTRRFIGDDAVKIAQIDQDTTIYWEYSHDTYIPVCLVEAAIYVGEISKKKAYMVTRHMAEMCKLPAYVVLYKIADYPNPKYPHVNDIEYFWVKKINPGISDWVKVTPRKWAQHLLNMRSITAKAACQMEAEESSPLFGAENK